MSHFHCCSLLMQWAGATPDADGSLLRFFSRIRTADNGFIPGSPHGCRTPLSAPAKAYTKKGGRTAHARERRTNAGVFISTYTATAPVVMMGDHSLLLLQGECLLSRALKAADKPGKRRIRPRWPHGRRRLHGNRH